MLKFFWKGQVAVIKSRVVGYDFSLKFYIVWGVTLCQPKFNSFTFFIIS